MVIINCVVCKLLLGGDMSHAKSIEKIKNGKYQHHEKHIKLH